MDYLGKFFRPNYGLKILADNSYRAVNEGDYDVVRNYQLSHEPIDMRKSLLKCVHTPLITEIKLSSPSKVKLSASLNEKDINSVARDMVNNGATALSILTQPYLFSGSISHIATIRKHVAVPILMKDVIISEVQIDSAKKVGADCVLLIKSVFDQDLAEGSIQKFSDMARSKGLFTLVEVHSENEFNEVLEESESYDMIGINNRNLNTLEIDLGVTERLLKEYNKGKNVIISESGISTSEQIISLKKVGADAFLVGTSILESGNIASKVAELYHSL